MGRAGQPKPGASMVVRVVAVTAGAVFYGHTPVEKIIELGPSPIGKRAEARAGKVESAAANQ